MPYHSLNGKMCLAGICRAEDGRYMARCMRGLHKYRRWLFISGKASISVRHITLEPAGYIPHILTDNSLSEFRCGKGTEFDMEQGDEHEK